MIEIRPTLPGDSWLVLADLRQCEVDELAALGLTSEQNMRYGLAHSDAQTVFIHGEAAGIFGFMEYETHRECWGVFTCAIERYPLPFLRACRRVLKDFHGSQWVDCRNTRAVDWFQWLGFEVSEPFTVNGRAFRKVTR